ncbi:MAG: mismatch-specific DNA-glycosylase [Alphaproteobacteria bacterium]|nr:mismatch-specific DNA-glycosylase [Alphaproteobacteria bacterium]
MLDDVLAPNLRLVICGTAVGETSAAKGEYYASPRNKFWRTLHEVGLTARRLAPREFRDLLTFGIGLTDVAKGQAGSDAGVNFSRARPNDVRAKVLRFAPAILAFNGKKAAGVFLGSPNVRYGLQLASVGATRLFVAPSTSGAANGHWDIECWRELARLAGVEAERN